LTLAKLLRDVRTNGLPAADAHVWPLGARDSGVVWAGGHGRSAAGFRDPDDSVLLATREKLHLPPSRLS
jgi:hypothetical protein